MSISCCESASPENQPLIGSSTSRIYNGLKGGIIAGTTSAVVMAGFGAGTGAGVGYYIVENSDGCKNASDTTDCELESVAVKNGAIWSAVAFGAFGALTGGAIGFFKGMSGEKVTPLDGLIVPGFCCWLGIQFAGATS